MPAPELLAPADTAGAEGEAAADVALTATEAVFPSSLAEAEVLFPSSLEETEASSPSSPAEKVAFGDSVAEAADAGPVVDCSSSTAEGVPVEAAVSVSVVN